MLSSHGRVQYMYGERLEPTSDMHTTNVCSATSLGAPQSPTRRHLMIGAAGALAAAALRPLPATANVPAPYDWNAAPPTASKSDFVEWMVKNRGEDRGFLGQRWDRFQQLLARRDLWDERDMRAFLLTPREEFVTKPNLSRAYEWHYLAIGFGVTITGPHTVARMTNSLNVQFGDKVLEIGNGSGYQSAYLANLTDKIWSIEIIRPLWERTREIGRAHV